MVYLPFSQNDHASLKFESLTDPLKIIQAITEHNLLPFKFAMLATGNHTRLSVQDVGARASVPDDPYIRLGYYLDCVRSTDLPEQIPLHLADYQHMNGTQYQSNQALSEMIAWADGYSPQKLQNTGFFTMVSDGSMGNSGNNFLRVTATSTEVALISGNSAALAVLQNSRAAVDIMLFTKNWANNNFYGPRQALIRVIQYREAEARRQQEAYRHLGGGGAPAQPQTGDKQSTCCNVY
jgi:hypothetical protein